MWDLIVSVPDHCLSFYFKLSGQGHLISICNQDICRVRLLSVSD